MTYARRELEMDAGTRNLPKRTKQTDGYSRFPSTVAGITEQRARIARELEIERLRGMIDRSKADG